MVLYPSAAEMTRSAAGWLPSSNSIPTAWYFQLIFLHPALVGIFPPSQDNAEPACAIGIEPPIGYRHFFVKKTNVKKEEKYRNSGNHILGGIS